MSTYLSTKFQMSAAPAGMDGPVSTSVTASFKLSGALALHDVIKMFRIPPGATVTRVHLVSDALDADATPLISLSVGDSESANGFIDASPIGRTGGSSDMDAGVHPKAYTTEDYLAVTVVAGPAKGAAAGKISLTAFMVLK